MTITLCMLVKNEAASIIPAINSVKPYVNEIIVVDDHSTDDTVAMATIVGAKVLPLPFTVKEKGFAEAANWMISQATSEWILIVDGDELVEEAHNLHALTRYPNIEAWALPRRKWFNYDMKARIEYDSYPDWQVRFFRNKPENRFVGEMHVRFQGSRIHKAFRGPHVEHLQVEYRSEAKRQHRKELYTDLAARQGVAIQGGYTLPKGTK